MFTVLFSFVGFLATNCVSLTHEPYIAISTLLDLNPIDLNYYPFMISLDKCNGISNAVDDLPTKLCVPSKTKDANCKVANCYLIR